MQKNCVTVTLTRGWLVTLLVVPMVILGATFGVAYNKAAHATQENSEHQVADHRRFQQQGAALAHQQRVIVRQQKKLCTAIAGAIHFWKGVRATTYELLHDKSLTPTARASNQHYVQALSAVISRGERLECVRRQS